MGHGNAQVHVAITQAVLVHAILLTVAAVSLLRQHWWLDRGSRRHYCAQAQLEDAIEWASACR